MDDSFQNGMVAYATGGQPLATVISRTFSRFSVVANVGDSAVLPTASPALRYVVKNAGSASMNIFPNPIANPSGLNLPDQINALAGNAPFALGSGKMVEFFCMVSGTWDTLPAIP